MSTTTNSQLILYCYVNQTQRVQVAKLLNSTLKNGEKVVFPREKFLFETAINDRLNIYTSLAGETTSFNSIFHSTLQTQTSTANPLELAGS